MQASSSCRAQASHCSGIPCYRALASVVVTCGLRGPEACGILRAQGANLCLLYCQVDAQPLDHQGSPKFSSRSFVVLGLLVFFFFSSLLQFYFPIVSSFEYFSWPILAILEFTPDQGTK